MKKLALEIGTLFLLASVLPTVAASMIYKTSGNGYYSCLDGQTCHTSWTAQVDKFGQVKGDAQTQQRSGLGTLHAHINGLYVVGSTAFVRGVVYNPLDAMHRPRVEICFVVKDGGNGGVDQITRWYYDMDLPDCVINEPRLEFHELLGGNAIVA